ncbi:MAG: hypothetical protein SGJ27_06630 [Candidatus Melainabacteria bacterium]|nr:hypothetical protein [Candidatus Melainabacteria bacterium]
MNYLNRLGLSVAALAAVLSVQSFVAPAHAADEPVVQFAVTKAASAVDITVYGEGFGQVEELRRVQLSAGTNSFQLNGIAAKYRQDSLSIISATGPGDFKYKSANYQAANLTPERVLELSVGKQVTITVGSGATSRSVTGELLYVRGGQAIVTTAGGGTVVGNPSDIEVGKLAAGLSASASLVIEAEVTKAGVYNLNFLYETDGLGWNAKHTVVYNEDKQVLESFNTTVNVVNQSGTSFDNANLWLLSGNVQAPRNRGMRVAAAEYAAAPAMFDAPGGGASVESVGERKVYRIPGRVSIGDGQSRQLPLFSGANVAVEQEYVVPAHQQYYGAEASVLSPVNVRLKLKNCAEHNLGTPLPAGNVKVLQRNSESRLQVVNNYSLKELAKDEVFEIGLGTSSDVKAERVLTKSTTVVSNGPAPRLRPGQDAPEWQDQDFEVKVFNFKDKKNVTVLIEVATPADQNVVLPLTRVTATLATGKVSVTAGKSEVLNYTLRVRTR